MLRGRNEGILALDLDVAHEAGKPHPAEAKIKVAFNIADRGRPADAWLAETVRLAWKAKLAPSLESDLLARLKERADAEAISVFSKNLNDLLLAAPAGPRVTMGLDPGLPHRRQGRHRRPDRQARSTPTPSTRTSPSTTGRGALATLAALCMKHKVDLVSIGNGTGSRETDKLVAELIAKMPQLKLTKAMVSEAGASVYSASELAANEFPDLDVSLRGAVSIARRLQDPLAELVKIEPKAIGVGQYQHDVDQTGLARSLDAVVEDCVNSVGVDVNTASAPLLARVSGLNKTLASNIVAFRDSNGAFKARTGLKKVPRLGPKAFEQAAGFLRIMDGKNPLDASAVHPEAYPVVEKISEATKRPLKSIIGDVAFLKTLKPATFADGQFGVPTVTDIIAELEKPGRDPRPEFKTATFQEGVEKISDLKPGMQLEGVVTNVTAFGAFVDVGVHQDGLVHISELSDRFVKDPREVVKAGDVVKVRVKDVDVARKRIALTMKSGAIDRSAGATPRPASAPPSPRAAAPPPPRPASEAAARKRARRRPAPRARAQVAQPQAIRCLFPATLAATAARCSFRCRSPPSPHAGQEYLLPWGMMRPDGRADLARVASASVRSGLRWHKFPSPEFPAPAAAAPPRACSALPGLPASSPSPSSSTSSPPSSRSASTSAPSSPASASSIRWPAPACICASRSSTGWRPSRSTSSACRRTTSTPTPSTTRSWTRLVTLNYRIAESEVRRVFTTNRDYRANLSRS